MASAALIISTTQWSQDVTQLDNLLADHQSGYTPANVKGIRKNHWKPRNSRSKCVCKKSFGITERQHHCRRCGDIFCKECASYQRRLNNLAHPDPNGKLYKVCRACFDQGPQELGQTRKLNSVFNQWRDASHNPNNTLTNNGKPFTRRSINIHTESNRLREGFKEDVQKSGFKKAAQKIKSMVSNPEWLKSRNWLFENMVPQCRVCSKSFGMLRSRNHCAFCSVALCSGCLYKDVILFANGTASVVHIAVIKVVGCPETEPDICMYLKTCAQCKGKLEELQISKEHENIKLDELSERQMMWKEIVEVEEKLMSIQTKIDKHLPEYQELVEALEINPGSAKALPQRKQSNTQLLAKAQGDLSDHLTELVMTIHSLKKFTPSTKSQGTILKNIIKSRCEYYQENMYVFRECRRKLEELTPKEVLECIQMIVDKNAINSCYICVKQLCLEILHMSTKHALRKDLPAQLAQLEQILEEELKSVIERSGEDYTQHQQIINQLLQLQLKDHRLIKSSRIQKALAANRVCQYTNEKVCSLLTQVHLQLMTKVAHRSFTRSKNALEAAVRHVNGTDDSDEMDGDWTLLNKD